jgi:outer membrane protein OmpA-like peptidoglycan-associated protein
MTSTSEETTTVQGAPRRVVEDAWVAMNRRYLIGTGVLVAALLLLWAAGRGPTAVQSGAGPQASDGGGRPVPAATVPAGSGAGAPATAGGASGGTPAGVPAPAAASQAGAAGTGSTGPNGGSAASSPAIGAGAAPDAGGSAGSGVPAAGSAAATGRTGAPAAAAGNGSGAPATAAGSGSDPRTAGLPTPVPGAPVARLYFQPDQAWPSGEVGPKLAPVLARLRAEPGTVALVSGFHDRRGSAERNAELAQRRARAVRRVLIREGVAADRIVLARPQQTQGSGADREARRVEVTIAR